MIVNPALPIGGVVPGALTGAIPFFDSSSRLQQDATNFLYTTGTITRTSTLCRVGDVANPFLAQGLFNGVNTQVIVGKNLTNPIPGAPSFPYNILEISPALVQSTNDDGGYSGYIVGAECAPTVSGAGIFSGIAGNSLAPTYTGSAALTDGIAAFNGTPFMNGSGSLVAMSGAYVALYQGAGSIYEAIGVWADAKAKTGGTRTLDIGVLISGRSDGGTNNYGLWINGQSKTAAGSYSIFSDGTAPCAFAGLCGIGVVVPTAWVHLAAGTATANTGPLKFTSGTLLTTAEVGSHEYNGNHYLSNSAVRFPVGGTLVDHVADAGNVTTGETDLYSDSLVGNTWASVGDKVRARYAGLTVAHATATRDLRVYVGGTKIFDSGANTTSTAANWDMAVLIVRESSTVVRCTVTLTDTNFSVLASATYTRVTGLTLSGAIVVKITGQAGGVGAATNDIVAKLGTVGLEPAA